MKLKIPYIGTGEKGNEKRLDVDLGNVSWRLLSIDEDTKEFIVEVTPTAYFCYQEMVDDKLTGMVRTASIQDKTNALDFAKTKGKEVQ